MGGEHEAAVLPDGEYAIVEVLGHRTLVGRVQEVERFGTKLLSIEPLFLGKLLDPVLIGGSSIYQFTACSKDIAASQCPKQEWQLPSSVRVIVPPAMLPKPTDDCLDEEDVDFAPAFLSGGNE